MSAAPVGGPGPGRSLAYVPALDGLRAICVIGVLCFHAGFDWARGGFLGVSTFFTLSGYLVASLLFAEIDAQVYAGSARPRVSLAGFWRRRLRRLVPASVVTLLLVVCAAPWLMGPEAQGRLGADAIASLLYVVNWRFVQGEYAYTLLFSDPSLLQHYWSLAIEGQLYVVVPLLAAAATRTRDPRASFRLVVTALLVASTGIAFFLGADPSTHDRIYYGTGTRAPELLAGALLALALRLHPKETGRSRGRGVDVLGWVALAVLVAAFARLELTSDGLYRGGLTAFALVSVSVVAACVRGSSLPRALAWRPLVFVGEVSYAVYLFHWPVYRALDVWLEDPSPWVTLAVGGTATLLLAAASRVWVELPIRRGRGFAGRRPFLSSALAIGAVTAFTFVWLPAREVRDELVHGSMSVDEDASVFAPDPSRPRAARIAAFGDSIAYSLSRPLRAWLFAQPDVYRVKGQSVFGCGLLMPDFVAEVEAAGGDASAWLVIRPDRLNTRRYCLDKDAQLDAVVAQSDPDLAFVLYGFRDLLGVPGAAPEGVERVGDPATDVRLRAVMEDLVGRLTSRGATIAWATLPRFTVGKRYPMDPAEVEAARVHFNDLVRELAARHPGRVRIVDLAARLETWPGGVFDPALREDGVHFTRKGGTALLESGLGDELAELARDARAKREAED